MVFPDIGNWFEGAIDDNFQSEGLDVVNLASSFLSSMLCIEKYQYTLLVRQNPSSMIVTPSIVQP